MEPHYIETIAQCLESRGSDADHWLWCMSCTRFFPLDAVRVDGSATPCCPYADCYGYGFDYRLFYWDTDRQHDDPRWPSSTDELTWGMRSPEMESYYRAKLDRRIAHIVREFEAATGCTARYLPCFLTMMSDLCWDLTDLQWAGSFTEDTARDMFDELPVWSRTSDVDQAPVMLDELRRFYRFAEGTQLVQDPGEWSEMFADDELVNVLVYRMETDRRLIPRAPHYPRTKSPVPRKSDRKRTRRARRKRRK